MAKAAKKSTSKSKTGAKRPAPGKSAGKKSSSKKAAVKKSSAKKGATKKISARKNKLGVKNSLVNNINAHKRRGDSKSKKKSTIDEPQYNKMQKNWGRDK